MTDHPGFWLTVMLGLCGVALFGMWQYEKAYPCLRYERREVDSTYWVTMGELSYPITETRWENVCVERAP